MKLKQAIPFRQHPRVRLALGIILASVLLIVILARQQGWIDSPPSSSQTVACQDLNTGCEFSVGKNNYRAILQNGTLHIYGQATGIQAAWPQETAVWLHSDDQKHWTRAAPAQQPAPAPLMLMINRHQIRLETRQP